MAWDVTQVTDVTPPFTGGTTPSASAAATSSPPTAFTARTARWANGRRSHEPERGQDRGHLTPPHPGVHLPRRRRGPQHHRRILPQLSRVDTRPASGGHAHSALWRRGSATLRDRRRRLLSRRHRSKHRRRTGMTDYKWPTREDWEAALQRHAEHLIEHGEGYADEYNPTFSDAEREEINRL